MLTMNRLVVFYFILFVNQALAHNYWLAWCNRVITAKAYDLNHVKHAFCECNNFNECSSFKFYSDSSNIGFDKSPCKGRERSFKDNRGKHWIECNGKTLVALRHEDGTKDYCTTKYKHSWIKKGGFWGHDFKCNANWWCGYEVKINDPR